MPYPQWRLYTDKHTTRSSDDYVSLSRFTVYGMLCLHCKEAPRMASVRFTDVQARPTEFLDVTSVTRDEFQQPVPPVEAVFQAPMAA
jgi:hypothetical protein